jgi:hypothetical protein
VQEVHTSGRQLTPRGEFAGPISGTIS